MSEQDRQDVDEWASFASEVNASFFEALERNVEAQSEFVEAWTETVEASFSGIEDSEEVLKSQARASEIWMEAAEEQYEELLAGEELSTTKSRDRWLQAANEAFSEMMGTSAFAAATGQSIEQALEAQQDATETAEDTLHALGFATRSDVLEVGDRLVELERRQHAVEDKLDQILEAIEE